MTYLIASIFDPRQKTKLVFDYLTSYYNCVDEFYIDDPSHESVNFEVLRVM